MRRIIVLCGLISCAVLTPLVAGTFYLYIEEETDGVRGTFLPDAREGLIDGFFTADHIIFDDAVDPASGNRLSHGDVRVPLADARRGGAEYLIAVRIVSTVHETNAGEETLDSVVWYFLYEVGTGRLIGKGSLEDSNEGREGEYGRKKYGFSLGEKIARLIQELLS
ncbi:MAG TPA: hypothetical protein ENN69_02470 [Spirochaetia bacterium]|nr:hypothetical protein [Spirochaetia bacterium]